MCWRHRHKSVSGQGWVRDGRREGKTRRGINGDRVGADLDPTTRLYFRIIDAWKIDYWYSWLLSLKTDYTNFLVPDIQGWSIDFCPNQYEDLTKFYWLINFVYFCVLFCLQDLCLGVCNLCVGLSGLLSLLRVKRKTFVLAKLQLTFKIVIESVVI